VREKLTVCSPFFAVFPFDQILTATKDVNVHFFIDTRNSCKLYQRIPQTFRECEPKYLSAKAFVINLKIKKNSVGIVE
jgi:hypothetical protein